MLPEPGHVNVDGHRLQRRGLPRGAGCPKGGFLSAQNVFDGAKPPLLLAGRFAGVRKEALCGYPNGVDGSATTDKQGSGSKTHKRQE